MLVGSGVEVGVTVGAAVFSASFFIVGTDGSKDNVLLDIVLSAEGVASSESLSSSMIAADSSADISLFVVVKIEFACDLTQGMPDVSKAADSNKVSSFLFILILRYYVISF